MLIVLHRYFVTLVLATMIGVAPIALAELAANNDAVEAIGKVIIAKGKVNAIGFDGAERELKRRAVIQKGDTISTGLDSKVLMRLKDGSKFELGADASLKLTDFAYNESADDDKVVADALKGVFRFVTGKVAKQKPESMKVRTAVATIGVRGTHVLGEIKDDGSTTIILLEQEEDDVQRKTAIDVGNSAGSVSVDQPGWGTYIADADTAPTPARRMRIQTIQNIMRSVQAVQRIPIPRARPRF